MALDRAADHLVEQAGRHWERRRQAVRPEAEARVLRPLTIALAREAGAGASLIGAEVGRRLGWTVYGRDLVDRIAQEMGLRSNLLETLDEHHTSWLSDAMEQFLSTNATPYVGENAFVKHLVETILALGTHGECVIVGRGSATILPAETTLRVRLVAPFRDRVASTAARLRISIDAATERVSTLDRERARFVRDHFLKDPEDARSFDLILNTSRFSINDCADLIIDALHRLAEARLAAVSR
jgi:cytidylate kinase